MIDPSQPITIGNVRFRNRVFLAPMSGVTDLPFRKLAWQAGAGMVVSEMVATSQLRAENDKTKRRMKGSGLDINVVQLLGCDPYWMMLAAKVAEDEGAQLIDINMGCPAKKVTGKAAGSALMRDPVTALKIIKAVLSSVKVPVSLKLRLGWDQLNLNAAEIAKSAEDAGIAMITVHGRTRDQFYRGRANWRAVRTIKSAVKIPVVVNGDISTFDDLKLALKQSKADAVMIGRASYGQPWIIGKLANVQQELNLSRVITEHYNAMLEHYGYAAGARHARKHLDWYINRHFDGAFSAAERRALLTTADSDVVRELIATISERALSITNFDGTVSKTND